MPRSHEDRSMNATADLHERFVRSPFDVRAPIAARDIEGRWAERRSAIRFGDTTSIDLLAARFPVTRRLVGEESFHSWRVDSSAAIRRARRLFIVTEIGSRASSGVGAR